MNKIIKRMLFIIVVFIFNISNVLASSKNLVNIYLFHSDSCPHCNNEIKLLDELSYMYDNIRIYKYEISDKDNAMLLEEACKLYDVTVTGVPVTIIGDKVYKGFSMSDTKSRFMAVIEYYSDNGYVDKFGEYLGNVELPSYPDVLEDNDDALSKYIDDYLSYKIDIPIIGCVDTKNLTLPVISVLMGLVDGFNPCAMWVLLFLISVLTMMKDKKRMFILGISFLLSSALIYLLFMVAWLNVASVLTEVVYIRIIIGLLAICGAGINLVSYYKHRKDNGCNIVNDKKRNRIFKNIQEFTHEKSLILAIIGIVLLAVSVNFVELACSSGLPLMFVQILSLNNLTLFEECLYIALYMICFLLDDLIVFLIAIRTMEVTGFSSKYGKISKLVGGILLFLIGILLIFKPDWLMFNF